MCACACVCGLKSPLLSGFYTHVVKALFRPNQVLSANTRLKKHAVSLWKAEADLTFGGTQSDVTLSWPIRLSRAATKVHDVCLYLPMG